MRSSEGIKLLTSIINHSEPYFDALQKNSSLSEGQQPRSFQGVGPIAKDLASFYLKHPDELKLLCNKSYSHDNAFDKIVLCDRQLLGFEIRIHFWPQATKSVASEQNIHNHSADFVSYLLAGAIEEEEFLKTGNEENNFHHKPVFEFSHYFCSSAKIDHSYRMTRLGSKRLTKKSASIYRAGDVHALKHSVLHRLRILDSPTITLFVQDERCSRGTDVFTKLDKSVVTENSKRELQHEVITKVMKHIADFSFV